MIQNLTSILGSTSWYEVVGHIEITAVPYAVLAHISNEVKSHMFYISPQGSKIPCRIFAAHPLKVKGYKMVLYSCETRTIHVLQEILGIGLKQNRYYPQKPHWKKVGEMAANCGAVNFYVYFTPTFQFQRAVRH